MVQILLDTLSFLRLVGLIILFVDWMRKLHT